MGTKYTSQSATGYNASPPPDDGTTVAANKITWSGIKTKLADSIYNWISSVNSALVTALDVSASTTSVNYTTAATDHQKPIYVTGTTTISLGDATTMGTGYQVPIINTGTALVTVGVITATDTLNGTANGTITLPPYSSGLFETTSGANGYVMVLGKGDDKQTANIASAATVNLDASTPFGNYAHITGTTTITAITLQKGSEFRVVFDGILTLTNGASLILPGGANITTAAGDSAVFRGEASSVVRCVSYQLASGQAISSTSSQQNLIKNGGFVIDQENEGAATTPTANAYPVDMWLANLTQASKLTFQRVTDAPTGAKYSLKVTVAAQFSPGATDSFFIGHRIEGIDIIDYKLGTASAVTMTTSAQVKSSITGTFACAFRNSAGNRSYIGTYTINSAATWTPLVITVAGDQAGTWLTDKASVGLEIDFDLGSGSNYNTTAGAWQAGNFTRTSGSVTFVNQVNGSTWQIANVKNETGSAATSYIEPHYTVSRQACQRYYCKTFPDGTAPANGGGAGTSGAFRVDAGASTANYAPTVNWRFPVEMMAAPTVTLYNDRAGGAAGQWNNASADSANARALWPTTGGVHIDNSGTALATGTWWIAAKAVARL